MRGFKNFRLRRILSSRGFKFFRLRRILCFRGFKIFACGAFQNRGFKIFRLRRISKTGFQNFSPAAHFEIGVLFSPHFELHKKLQFLFKMSFSPVKTRKIFAALRAGFQKIAGSQKFSPAAHLAYGVSKFFACGAFWRTGFQNFSPAAQFSALGF